MIFKINFVRFIFCNFFLISKICYLFEVAFQFIKRLRLAVVQISIDLIFFGQLRSLGVKRIDDTTEVHFQTTFVLSEIVLILGVCCTQFIIFSLCGVNFLGD